ncbi:hypothetical protein B7939_00600 [Eggerthia catenaformis]|nr:hypothetical protein B7939_00600 [Eggerthia catenaformis]
MKFEKVSFEEFLKKCRNIKVEYSFKEIKDLYDKIKLPSRSTKNSAGYDFYFPLNDKHFNENKEYAFPTGIKVKLESDKFLGMYPRSSLGFKYGFQILNTVGIIDADYYGNSDNEGHIMMAFKLAHPLYLRNGDKYCQGIIQQYFRTYDDQTEGVRTGGIGSTDERR